MGTPAEAKGNYVEGDIYRLWSRLGCFIFKYGTSGYFMLGVSDAKASSASHEINFYPAGCSTNADTDFIGYSYNVTSSVTFFEDYGSSTAQIEHWVPDS